VAGLELISLAELQEIRRIWVVEKHEIEDSLPRIYEEATGRPYQGPALNHGLAFGREEMDLLRSLCGGDELHFGLVRELLDVERKYRFHVRRSGLFDALEKAIRKAFYDDEADAVDRARRERDKRGDATRGAQGAFIREGSEDDGADIADSGATQ
jgi:DNA sulfur modification protein DndC